MKLSTIEGKKKKDQPHEVNDNEARRIMQVLEETGISEEVLVFKDMLFFLTPKERCSK